MQLHAGPRVERELGFRRVEVVGRPERDERDQADAHDLEPAADGLTDLVATLSREPDPELLRMEVLGVPRSILEIERLAPERHQLGDAQIIARSDLHRHRDRIAQGGLRRLVDRFAAARRKRAAALILPGHVGYFHRGYSHPGCAFPLDPNMEKAPGGRLRRQGRWFWVQAASWKYWLR